MANDFATLRKNRGNSLATLLQEVEKMSSGGAAKEDERFWQPEVDKLGNGSAVIRFMDAAPGEDTKTFVRLFKHGFKHTNNKWFIQNCPTTLGGECPVCASNSEHWESGDESRKKIASARKRKLQYIANVLIIKDPKNPENEGQVKLFAFGKKIFDKITEAAKPRFEDDTPVNVFDLWEGANFNLRIVKEDGFRNYDRSTFASPSPIAASDKDIEAIWRKCHDLNELVSPDKFNSAEQMKARFNQVIGGAGVASAADQINDMQQDYTPPAPAKRNKPAAPAGDDVSADIPFDGAGQSSGAADDDEDAYFASLLGD